MQIPTSSATSESFDIARAIASGDIQTLIQMVQGERVRLLDEQLVDQVKAVQARNDKIAKLNEVLSLLTAFQGAIRGTSASSTIPRWGWDKVEQYEIPLNDAIREAGLEDLGFKGAGRVTPGPGESLDDGHGHVVGTRMPVSTLNALKPVSAATQKEYRGTQTNTCNSGTDKGQIDTAITKIKGLIDAESNNQQMDMLRLQGLNNKKNESVEVLTNTQKKHTDANSNIIRNI